KVLLHVECKRTLGNGAFPLVALSPDGSSLAVIERSRDAGDRVHCTLSVVDVETGRSRQLIEIAGTLGQVTFSPDGKRLEGGTRTGDWNTSGAAEYVVWDVATGNRVCTIEGDTLNLVGFRPNGSGRTWSPDGTRLAYADASGERIQLFDATTG